MRKKINLNELRRLVKDTISETWERQHQLAKTKSAKKREQIIENVIKDTVRALVLFEGLDDDAADDPSAENANQDGDQGTTTDQQQSSSTNLAVSQDRPAIAKFAQFMELAVNGELELKGAKNVIDQFLKKTDANGMPFWKMVLSGQGHAADKTISFSPKAFSVSDLKPSQAQVFLPQSISGYLTRPDGKYGPSAKETLGGELNTEGTRGIFTSQDGYIVDGHHRSSAAYGLNPSVRFTTMCVNKDIEAALSVLNIILDALVKADTNGAGKAYQASGEATNSIWNKPPTKEACFEVLNGICQDQQITAGGETFQINGDYAGSSAAESWIKFLTFVKSTGLSLAVEEGKGRKDAVPAQGEEGQEGYVAGKPEFSGSAGQEDHTGEINESNYQEVAMKFCEYVASNLNSWNGPESKFPKRTDMPQLEDKGTGKKYYDKTNPNLEDGLPAGTFDHSAPHQMEESIDLRRWHKLAGLLKD